MNLKEGQIVKGEITRVVEEAAFVDIGATQDAIIPRKDLEQLDTDQFVGIRNGVSVKVCIVHLPDRGGTPIVSAAQVLDRPSYQSQGKDPWNVIEDAYQVGDLVKGVVKDIKKYGAFVNTFAKITK